MSATKVLKYNSLFLGTVMFMFGFLKFFDPINTWFHVQILKSGLPPLSIPMGIASEIAIGLGLLLASFFREKIGSLFSPIVSLASAGLIFNMAVAIYVHLQPEVPADVLPLGIKPPFIPLIVMLLAVLNLFELHRAHDDAPSMRGPVASRAKKLSSCDCTAP
jgi:hypothetical protein